MSSSPRSNGIGKSGVEWSEANVLVSVRSNVPFFWPESKAFAECCKLMSNLSISAIESVVLDRVSSRVWARSKTLITDRGDAPDHCGRGEACPLLIFIACPWTISCGVIEAMINRIRDVWGSHGACHPTIRIIHRCVVMEYGHINMRTLIPQLTRFGWFTRIQPNFSNSSAVDIGQLWVFSFLRRTRTIFFVKWTTWLWTDRGGRISISFRTSVRLFSTRSIFCKASCACFWKKKFQMLVSVV